MKTGLLTLAALAMLVGCGLPGRYAQDRKKVQDAQVIAFCSVSVESNQLVHTIREIWKDQSQGSFTVKVGDEVRNTIPPQPSGPVSTAFGETALLYYYTGRGQAMQHSAIYFYNGKSELWGDKNKEQIKAALVE